jgi:hypothetical protein
MELLSGINIFWGAKTVRANECTNDLFLPKLILFVIISFFMLFLFGICLPLY